MPSQTPMAFTVGTDVMGLLWDSLAANDKHKQPCCICNTKGPKRWAEHNSSCNHIWKQPWSKHPLSSRCCSSAEPLKMQIPQQDIRLLIDGCKQAFLVCMFLFLRRRKAVFPPYWRCRLIQLIRTAAFYSKRQRSRWACCSVGDTNSMFNCSVSCWSSRLWRPNSRAWYTDSCKGMLITY